MVSSEKFDKETELGNVAGMMLKMSKAYIKSSNRKKDESEPVNFKSVPASIAKPAMAQNLPDRFLRIRQQYTDVFNFTAKIKYLALKSDLRSGEVRCSHKVLHSGFNTFLSSLKGGTFNPSARIKNRQDWEAFWNNYTFSESDIDNRMGNYISGAKSGIIERRYIPSSPDVFVFGGWLQKSAEPFKKQGQHIAHDNAVDNDIDKYFREA